MKKAAKKAPAKKKTPAKKAQPTKRVPTVDPWAVAVAAARALDAPLVVIATVTRPLGGGAVDVAGLAAGAFVSIGTASDAHWMVAAALAAWGNVARPKKLCIAGDASMNGAEAALSALASKLGREVHFFSVPELEVDAPSIARLATIDRGSRRAYLTSIALHEGAAAAVRIDPMALDDEASQRPVKLTREGSNFIVTPKAR